MQALLATVLEQWRAQSGYEVTAVALAVTYLLLAIRQSIWCWPCAFSSSAIYVGLFIEARLYMEAILYGAYAAMAVYGWSQWRHSGSERDLPVLLWPRRRHVKAVGGILLLAGLCGLLLERYTNAAYPYLDSLTTVAALWTTFLVARKVLENWAYWLVIDAVSIVIYWQRELELTALLFVAYVVMIPFGYFAWRRTMASSERMPVT